MYIPDRSRWSYYDENVRDLSLSELNNLVSPPVSEDPSLQNIRLLNSAILDRYSVKYIVLSSGDTSSGEEFFPEVKEFDEFKSFLDSLPYLEIIDLAVKDLFIYKNVSYYPFLFSSDAIGIPEAVSNWSYTPTSHTFVINSNKNTILFNEPYNPNWQIYLGTPTWYDILFGYKPLEQVAHVKNEFGLNTFDLSNINLDTLSDTEEVTMTLFFKPQAYYILGLIISGTTSVLLVGYLVIYSLIGIRKNVLSAPTRHTGR